MGIKCIDGWIVNGYTVRERNNYCTNKKNISILLLISVEYLLRNLASKLG